MKRTFAATLLILSAQFALPQEEINGAQRLALQHHIFQSEMIAEVCVYKERWEGPKSNQPPKKGIVTRYGVVTNVHKGNLKVGTKVEFENLIENAPNFFSDFTAVVEGDLWVLLFTPRKEDVERGVYRLGDSPFRFRFGERFHELFEAEKRADPQLKGKEDRD